MTEISEGPGYGLGFKTFNLYNQKQSKKKKNLKNLTIFYTKLDTKNIERK